MISLKNLTPLLLGTTLVAPLLLVPRANAQVEDPKGGEARLERLLDEHWTVMVINGEESGWTHTRIVEVGEGEALLYRRDYESYDRFLNMGVVTVSRQQSWSLEDHRGRLLEAHDRIEDGGDVTKHDLVVRGEQGEITATTLGVPRVRSVPWQGDVMGPTGAWLLAVEHGSEPGTCFSYRAFDFDLEGIGTTTRRILGPEEVELLDDEVRRLLHVVESSTSMPGIEVHAWCDEEYDTVKYEVSMAGLSFGEIMTTEERAKANEDAELQVDASDFVSAWCDVSIPSLLPVDSVLYRLQSKDESLGVPRGMGSDARQTILEDDGKITTLRVEIVTPPPGQVLSRDGYPEGFSEFIEPNPLIQSDHPGLKEKAIEVVGECTDAWEAACLLERFVYKYIDNFDAAVGYASAGRVFETKAGDCTEHAVLLAAMARAVGLPSRVASGFTYGDSTFWAHAWTEVWIGGVWYALDATRGEGLVDPGHLRFSVDSHHRQTSTETWLADVQGFSLDVEILEFTCQGRRHDVENEFRTAQVEGDVFHNTLFGIHLTRPPGYDFESYDDMPFENDPTLLVLTGQPTIVLMVEPRRTEEEYRDDLEGEGWQVLSQLPRKVAGRAGTAYTIEDEDGRYRALSFTNDHATFTLLARIEDEERDLPVFQEVVRSVVFE